MPRGVQVNKHTLAALIGLFLGVVGAFPAAMMIVYSESRAIFDELEGKNMPICRVEE